MAKTDKPNYSSGKTHFNRGKVHGESWCVRRETAIQNGTWRHGQGNRHRPDGSERERKP